MKNRLESGRWQWPAPTGYLSGSKSGSSLVIDPERRPLIARLFELVATGEHTKASALASVTALGLRSHKSVPLTQETVRKISSIRSMQERFTSRGGASPCRVILYRLCHAQSSTGCRVCSRDVHPHQCRTSESVTTSLSVDGFSVLNVRNLSQQVTARASQATSSRTTDAIAPRDTSMKGLRRSKRRSLIFWNA